MPPKNILIFIDWFLPGYKAGGPIQSVLNFITAFKNELEISVVTSDRDLGDALGYEGIQPNKWIEYTGYRVMYLDPQHQVSKQYKSIFKECDYDLIYFNSFFSFRFALLPLYIAKKNALKILLAPRGMLGEGALGIKPFKKRIFLVAAKFLGIYNGITFHATAENEKNEITSHFGSQIKVHVAPNIPSIKIKDNNIRKKKQNEVTLFFLSRIAPKKNLLGATRFLQKIDANFHIKFQIIGPIDDSDYWAQCKSQINALPANIVVNYIGAIPNNKLHDQLSNCHFLLFPTLHENYGHVIIESLAAGCPVIISNHTPWHFTPDPSPLSLGRGAGGEGVVSWDLPLENPQLWIEVIETCCRMGQEEYDAMSRRAYDYAQNVINDPSVLEANRRLFS
jgi:glycosyltransferase involved in cell wall biosynthesis